MPTTANTITYYVAADGTLRDGQQGSIPQQPRINYGTEYAVTLSFPTDTLQEGDQLQVALNRTRTFFSSASATGDAPVAAVAKHDVTAEEAAAQEVALTLSTNTRAMIDQVNGIDHPVRGFFGVHILRGQSFVTLAVADALMMSLESGPDAISPSLPVVDYPTRAEAEALAERSENAAERAEEAAEGIVPPLQLSSPPTTSTSGSIGQLAVYHDATTGKDHLYHLCFVSEGESATLYHWEECVLVSMGNVAGGYPVLDENGLVPPSLLPIATSSQQGAVKTHISYGTDMSAGYITNYAASNDSIDIRNSSYALRLTYQPIVPKTLDYAVRSVCKNITEIPAATSDYSLVDSSATTNNHSHVYSHSPESAPTYRLPQVTNTSIAHYIELTVDFTNVQTYSFLDYQGEPIVPLFTPAISAGDVYTFKMEYSNIKGSWLIYPQKQGAVADDFVMRGEVGAANGVAGLDADAKVPSGQLPIASSSVFGVVKSQPSSSLGNYGVYINSSGEITVTMANETQIRRRNLYPSSGVLRSVPIVPNNLNVAVTAALTDSNHITLNDAQKATAQEVFGVGGPITAIPAATSAYTLAEGIFTHAPTSAPTYTLPNITDDIRTHEVVLIIDFSSVQTFSFLVDGGGDVTFQSYANPTMGDVWAFRCWWYGGKWRICPMKIKNCVTRQLENGSLSITDAVAGDALALKMVAPQSVVVNQHINTTDTSVTLTSGRTWMTYIGGVGAKVTGEGQSVACTGGTDMAIDLTQYFNGNTTLIDSITSWDDLVAYDPRFAQYVEHNTGTVEGVQPQVKVSGKNLLDDSIRGNNNTYLYLGSTTLEGGILLPAGTYTWRVFYNGNESTSQSGGTGYISIDGTATYNQHTVTLTKPSYCHCRVYPLPAIDERSKYTAQIELGSSATSYEPYHDGGTAQAPEELFAVGTAADEFEAVAGVTTRNTLSASFNGTEQWGEYRTSSSWLGFVLPLFFPSLMNRLFYTTTCSLIASNTSTHVAETRLGLQMWFGANSRSLYVVWPISMSLPSALSSWYDASTDTLNVDAFTTWLTNNPFNVLYEAPEPTTSQSTPAQISLQAGSNVAMQTDGGRLAPIDITYESNEL